MKHVFLFCLLLSSVTFAAECPRTEETDLGECYTDYPFNQKLIRYTGTENFYASGGGWFCDYQATYTYRWRLERRALVVQYDKECNEVFRQTVSRGVQIESKDFVCPTVVQENDRCKFIPRADGQFADYFKVQVADEQRMHADFRCK